MSMSCHGTAQPASKLIRRVGIYETLGFGSMLALLVGDDLRAWTAGRGLRNIPTWELVETAAALGVAALTLVLTRRLMRRIRYLDGLISICMHCKRVRVGDRWIPIEAYVVDRSTAAFSHGFCSDCFERHTG